MTQSRGKPLRELDKDHRNALHWFATHAGLEMGWPQRAHGRIKFLATKAKGIYKPAGMEYALSVRRSLSSNYGDQIERLPDDSWRVRYAEEKLETGGFTNRALVRCMEDGVPIGVILQVKPKPDPIYRILGLGIITGVEPGVFEIREYYWDQNTLWVSFP